MNLCDLDANAPVKDEQMNIPYSIFFEVTNACNSNCLHCRTHIGEFLPNEMSTRELMDILRQLSNMGVPFVTFTGGEPLLREDILAIMEYSGNLGLKALLATNGLLLTSKMIDQLVAIPNFSIQISIDGSSPQVHDSFRGLKGSFERSLQAIKMCRKREMDISISMTLTKYNFKEVSEVINLGRQLKVPTIKLRRFVANGRGFENLSLLDLSSEEMRNLVDFYLQKKKILQDELVLILEQAPFAILSWKERIHLLQKAKKRICGGCSAGNAICVIDPVGNVRPCPSLAVNVGNVRDADLSTVWESSEILKRLRDRNNLKGRCGICSYKNICGGCRAEAYSRYDDYLAEDPKCWYNPAQQVGQLP